MVGSPTFALRVTGANFLPTSVVHWDGDPRSTRFVNEGTLEATIPDKDLVNPGSAQITVVTAGLTSNALTFHILVPTPTPTPTRTPTRTPTATPTVTSVSSVAGVSFKPPSGTILFYGQDVTVTGRYTTTEPGGVRIFARPFTRGALSPNYSASGSPLYPTGTGNFSGTFTITAAPAGANQVIVDQVRIQVYSADQSRLLFQTFVPANFRFTPPIG
jgi:hypothetical protein